MSEEAIFVLYAPSEKSWSIPVPEGWYFVGSGSTDSSRYPREFQLSREGDGGDIDEAVSFVMAKMNGQVEEFVVHVGPFPWGVYD